MGVCKSTAKKSEKNKPIKVLKMKNSQLINPNTNNNNPGKQEYNSVNIIANINQTQLNHINQILESPYLKQYIDPDFPPELTSLVPIQILNTINTNNPVLTKIPKSLVDECKTYQWKTFDQIYGEHKHVMFSKKFNAEEIIQGSLGSCYFLSAICGLVRHDEERIKRLFVSVESNSKGIYAVKMYAQGLETVICIDDSIPCKIDSKRKLIVPAFSHSLDKETCILILEKAWAKLNNKCYLNSYLGTPQEALSSLCEAPCVYEYHKRFVNKNQTQMLWGKLLEAYNRRWILCTSTEEIEEKANTIGIPTFHAFTILDAYEISPEGEDLSGVVGEKFTKSMKKSSNSLNISDLLNNRSRDGIAPSVRLIKLRNPTGDSAQFKGEFNENSKKWTKEIMKIVNPESKSSKFRPGTFLITFEEYVRYFPWTFICKYEDNYHYYSVNFEMTHNEVNSNQIEKDELVKHNINNDDKHIVGSDQEDNINPDDEIEEEKQDVKSIVTKSKYSHDHRPFELKSNLNNSSVNTYNNNNDSVIGIGNKIYSKSSYNVGISVKGNQSNMQFLNVPKAKISKKESLDSDFLLDCSIFENQIKNKELIICSIEITQTTRCFITLHQPQSRFNNEVIANHAVPLAYLIVAKYTKNHQSYAYVESDFINWEKLVLECVLYPGEYHIFAKSYVSQSNKYNLVISTYAEFPCNIYPVNSGDYPVNWLEKVMVDIAKKNPEKRFIPAEKSHQSQSNHPTGSSYSSNVFFDNNNFSGFSIFYYENTHCKAQMVVRLSFTKLEGLKILNTGLHKKQKLQNKIDFMIPAKSNRSVIFQIENLPWLCKLEYLQEVWFEYPLEYLLKKHSKSERMITHIIDKDNTSNTGIFLHEIPYDRGYILMVDNLTSNHYKANMKFAKMDYYEIEDFPDIKKVLFSVESESQFYVHIKGVKQDLDPKFKLTYKFHFVKYN